MWSWMTGALLYREARDGACKPRCVTTHTREFERGRDPKWSQESQPHGAGGRQTASPTTALREWCACACKIQNNVSQNAVDTFPVVRVHKQGDTNMERTPTKTAHANQRKQLRRRKIKSMHVIGMIRHSQ